MTDRTLIFGAPGTGKTTRIQSIIDGLLNEGYKMEDILFTTFNKSMAEVAADRLSKAYPRKEAVIRANFRTNHSMAYRLCKEEFGEDLQLVKDDDMKAFAMAHDWPLPSTFMEDPDNPSVRGVNDYFTLDALYWTRYPYKSIRKIFNNLLNAMTNIPYRFTPEKFEEFSGEWKAWKEDHGLVEFHDMIQLTIENNLSHSHPVQFYDEHQDIFPLSHMAAEAWMKNADIVYAAGDPFQVLYRFTGADPELFFNYKRDKSIVLEHSYRLPRKIWRWALRQIRDLPRYYPSDRPIQSVTAEDKPCILRRTNDITALAENYEDSGESLFILSRTNKQVASIAADLVDAGIVFQPLSTRKGYYGWTPSACHFVNAAFHLRDMEPITPEEAKVLANWTIGAPLWKRGTKKRLTGAERDIHPDDIRSYLEPGVRPGEILQTCMNYLDRKKHTRIKRAIITRYKRDLPIPPLGTREISIGTIHSAKGNEADAVALNITVPKGCWGDPDDYEENCRIFYVGVSRARKGLYLFESGKGIAWDGLR